MSNPSYQKGSSNSQATKEAVPEQTKVSLESCVNDLQAIIKNCEAAKQKGQSVSLGTIAQIAAVLAKFAPLIPQLSPKTQKILGEVSAQLQDYTSNPQGDMVPRLKKAVTLIQEIIQS